MQTIFAQTKQEHSLKIRLHGLKSGLEPTSKSKTQMALIHWMSVLSANQNSQRTFWPKLFPATPSVQPLMHRLPSLQCSSSSIDAESTMPSLDKSICPMKCSYSHLTQQEKECQPCLNLRMTKRQSITTQRESISRELLRSFLRHALTI